MERKVPVWFLLLCLLAGLLVTVYFGWLVRSAASGHSPGLTGDIALEVAGFPTKTRKVLRQLVSGGLDESGDYELRIPREQSDLSGFRPVESRADRKVDGLMVRVGEAAEPDWRVLIGAFSVDRTIQNAGLLLSPGHVIEKVWIFDEIPVGDFEPSGKGRKFVHGVDILDDASMIFSFDGGVSLQRIDRCGDRIWAIGGRFHHAVNLDRTSNTVWSFLGSTLTQVDVEDGRHVKEIPMIEVIEANPDIDILELRRLHYNKVRQNTRNSEGTWLRSPWHYNDVDPLPPALESSFPDFKAGDLLVSSRSLNLVYVLDPETTKIKWWRIGAFQRQHDPDWQPDGRITIYNNRMSRDYSEIISIDPVTYEKRVLFDGRSVDFYSRIRGRHQVLPSGHIVITSPQQGRAFEVNADGENVLEFVNTKPGTDDTNYVLSEFRRLPPELVELATAPCPKPESGQTDPS